ncbi:MAG: tripartite tricarboxylate transporter substrate binding protein, partial [Pseudacidovorax sp.]|nr:tripartite tricarboxylate transporter substrate binding protein [Pseudacidovorax sp.]
MTTTPFPAIARRRITAGIGAALICGAAVPAAWAEDAYPSKPITVVVPQAAGGANDVIARVVAQRLSQQLG